MAKQPEIEHVKFVKNKTSGKPYPRLRPRDRTLEAWCAAALAAVPVGGLVMLWQTHIGAAISGLGFGGIWLLGSIVEKRKRENNDEKAAG